MFVWRTFLVRGNRKTSVPKHLETPTFKENYGKCMPKLLKHVETFYKRYIYTYGSSELLVKKEKVYLEDLFYT